MANTGLSPMALTTRSVKTDLQGSLEKKTKTAKRNPAESDDWPRRPGVLQSSPVNAGKYLTLKGEGKHFFGGANSNPLS